MRKNPDNIFRQKKYQNKRQKKKRSLETNSDISFLSMLFTCLIGTTHFFVKTMLFWYRTEVTLESLIEI